MDRQAVHRLAGFLPLLLSLAALGLVTSALLFNWVTPQPDGDEGTPAHIFQLLIAAQMPLIIIFLTTTEAHDWPRTGKWLAAQIAAIGLALFPVFYFQL